MNTSNPKASTLDLEKKLIKDTKICVISFDHWDYDHHIVKALQKKGVQSFHIKIGNYKHASYRDKVTNALSKTFLRKNLKKIRRQKYILSELESAGFQDQILVINPEIIDIKYHQEIKKYTDRYIAYLYDSTSRNPVSHLLDDIFDEIFSFDKADIQSFGFSEAYNYNYIDQLQLPRVEIIYDAVYVGSFDSRIDILIRIGNELKSLGLAFKFIIVGKNRELDYLEKDVSTEFITFLGKPLKQVELLNLYQQSRVIIDLIRGNQTGLSFRFFEALGLNKKVITNNVSVKAYDFYQKENILLYDQEEITIDYFKKPYRPLLRTIYKEYTLDTWIIKVFSLGRYCSLKSS